MWRFIVWFLPMIFLSIIGVFTGAWGAGLGLALVWLGFCVYRGGIIVPQQEFVVIERLGKYHTVYFRGWHFMVIGVDSIHLKGDMRAKRLRMYTDENGRTDRAMMDFIDGSAAITASVWYQIGSPDDVDADNRDALRKAVQKWTYVYEDPVSRVDNLVDSELRPLIQAESIDEASKKRDGIAEEVMRKIKDDLSALGTYAPRGGKRLVIEDIDLPDNVIALRELALEGEKRAQESEKESAGYWKSILAIHTNLGVSVPEARSIYETQRGLDTLRETKPAMTLVGKDFSGVLGTINLGTKP